MMGESSELFVNCLEAMVETCLPGDDAIIMQPSRHHILSSSLSSINLGSPTEKGKLLDISTVHIECFTNMFLIFCSILFPKIQTKTNKNRKLKRNFVFISFLIGFIRS